MEETTASRQPNILFILIDDMGWKDLGCYGSTFYETPRLDRLAAESMRFTDAYASCPVCSPTRASVMSGKYPAHVGITNYIYGRETGRLIDVPYLDHLPQSEVSLATSLKKAGYQTWHIGKWHLGGEGSHPEDHGFDVNIGGCHMGCPPSYFAPYGIPVIEDPAEGTYLTDHLTDEAVRLIRANDGKPFFMNLWHYAVHTPIQSPPELVAKYEEKARQMGLDKVKAIEEGEPFPCDHKKHMRLQRRVIQSDPAYAAMVENLDTNIGRVLDALEETGQAENTVVIFTSDNGGLATAEGSPTCNAPLAEGKGWMYEGGTREPLLIKWPGIIEPGSVCSVPTTTPDFYPTLLEMAGTEVDATQKIDGESMMAVLKGEGGFQRESIFWHYPHYGNQGGTPGASIRKGDHKLILFYEGDRVELYNLKEDPGERFNLADDQPELAAQLRGELEAWQRSIHAKIPQPNPDWVPPEQ